MGGTLQELSRCRRDWTAGVSTRPFSFGQLSLLFGFILYHLEKLTRGLEEKGLTIIPLELYFERGLAKCRIALARGKKLHDKRDDLHKKDAKREMDRLAKGSRDRE